MHNARDAIAQAELVRRREVSPEELVKAALRLLVDSLSRNDTVAIVTFGDHGQVVLEPTRATDENLILSVIENFGEDLTSIGVANDCTGRNGQNYIGT